MEGIKMKKNKIMSIIFFSLAGLFLLAASFGQYIFNEGTTLYEISRNNIGKFFGIIAFFKNNLENIIETIVVIVFLWLISYVLTIIINFTTKRGKRSKTIGDLLQSVVKYGSVTIGLFLILSAWGVTTPTLLASAGIIGLAVSFGAQSLIEDILAGLFIIFEKEFVVGDIIQVESFRGRVIEMGVRTTKLEDINGDVQIINNSDIRSAINTSYKHSPVICDVSIRYGADLVKIETVLKDNLSRMKEAVPHIKEGPFYFGVQELGQSSVVLRIYAKTEENDKYQARRLLNREIKLIFDENNIEIPINQLVVHVEKES